MDNVLRNGGSEWAYCRDALTFEPFPRHATARQAKPTTCARDARSNVFLGPHA